MEHTGHIKINRKNVPYHLVDDKVTLIPFDTYSALIPSEIKEKEIQGYMKIYRHLIGFVLKASR